MKYINMIHQLVGHAYSLVHVGWLTIGQLGRCYEGTVMCFSIIAWQTWFMWNRHFSVCASRTKAMVGYAVFARMILKFGIVHLW